MLRSSICLCEGSTTAPLCLQEHEVLSRHLSAVIRHTIEDSGTEREVNFLKIIRRIVASHEQRDVAVRICVDVPERHWAVVDLPKTRIGYDHSKAIA